MDDFQPYIFRTNDYGESWDLLTNGKNGIPSNHPTRVVREDPDRRGLLYAGTEFGMYISFDDGAHWQRFQHNLPVTPITDLKVHKRDLVVATQGRSFWVLDDLTPLHHLTDQVASAPAHLFKPRATYRTPGAQAGPGTSYVPDPVGGTHLKRSEVGDNPPSGAIIFYSFAEEPEEATLEILDVQGNVIRSFSSEEETRGDTTVLKKAGMNRFVWNLLYRGADLVEGAPVFGYTGGPRAVPGTYQVRLTVGEWSQNQSFEVMKDPRVPTTLAAFQEQFDLMIQVRDKITETHDAIRTIRSVRTQAQDLAARAAGAGNGGEIGEAAEAMSEKLTAVEGKLIQTKRGSLVAVQLMLHSQFGWLNTIVNSADARPTDQSHERFEELKTELARSLGELQEVLNTDLAAFNEMVRALGVPPVIVPQGATRGGVSSR